MRHQRDGKESRHSGNGEVRNGNEGETTCLFNRYQRRNHFSFGINFSADSDFSYENGSIGVQRIIIHT